MAATEPNEHAPYIEPMIREMRALLANVPLQGKCASANRQAHPSPGGGGPEDGGSNKRRIRVCVLNSDYTGSESPMMEYDTLIVGPQLYFDPKDPDFEFDVQLIKKATSFKQIRALVKSGRYDVFYSMVDGCREEDIAGFEVVQTLEEFNVPFTGVTAKWYEMQKADMKMIAYHQSITTARCAVVDSLEEAQRKCAALRFPLLIKNTAYGGSCGMTKDCKCPDMPSLLARLDKFLDEFQIALVEEFIEGEEVTVLACGDSTQPDGVRVFQPVTIDFPPGEDFKHFDLKWVEFGDMQWRPLPTDHRSYEKVMRVAADALKSMMGGVGYGRTDIRIDRETGEPYFLEINPQPGMMYPPGQEGSSDWIMRLDGQWNHRSFSILQMLEAVRNCLRRVSSFYRDFDVHRGYHLRAARDIAKGTVVLEDEGRSQRLYTRAFVERNWNATQLKYFRSAGWPVGKDAHIYAIPCPEPSTWHSFNHSCEPNLKFGPDRSLNCAAVVDIKRGEELTMDYRTFRDKTAEPFTCHCGASKCAKFITFGAPAEEDLLGGFSTSSNSGGATPEEKDLTEPSAAVPGSQAFP